MDASIICRACNSSFREQIVQVRYRFAGRHDQIAGAYFSLKQCGECIDSPSRFAAMFFQSIEAGEVLINELIQPPMGACKWFSVCR